MFAIGSLALITLLPFISASPAPFDSVAARPEQPLITPPPVAWTPSKTTNNAKRDIISHIESDLSSLLASASSDVAAVFSDFPAGADVQSSLGLDDSQVAALPTQVLNLPGYANYTDQGWNLRFRAMVYKQPDISQSKLDDLANGFLIGTSVQSLPAAQSSQAVNLTAEIYVIQQSNENITFSLAPAPTAGVDGGAVTPGGGSQIIDYPIPTTEEGDVDGFVQINNAGLTPGNATNQIQLLNEYVQGTNTGNASAYLVPDQGMTVISDIDDILRITQIYDPKNGLFNTFAKQFVPWMNMPEIYLNWSTSLTDLHFHYLTTTPEQATRPYMSFIYGNYPLGSFDTRPLNFSNVAATVSIRKYLLERIFQTFPQRKFILVADTSNSDVMRDYPLMATEFPNQVQCIFLRNTSATDPLDHFPYDTSGFQSLNQQSYMFFLVPDDLKNLDIANGHCYNASIKQNLTFGYQGLPFGLSTGSGNGSGNDTSSASRVALGGTSGLWGWAGLALLGSLMFGVL
ncbi:hypothetical protein MMC26_007341 [Xylographa opegraphella]|nr:hypothetical protein [Xylographa opegraphella]